MLQPEMKKALLTVRRRQRTIATTLSHGTVGIIFLCGSTTDPQKKAQYQAILDLGPGVVEECRSIADKADECLRSEMISEDAISSLVGRIARNRVKVLAVLAEFHDDFAFTT
jgi:hypothetical protein